MKRNVALSAVAGGLMSLAAALAAAQDTAVLDDLYGRGVHAYFSRDSFKAVELLNEAITNGSQDPRAYYFRGLALQTLGRQEDAALDFKEGAKLEQGAIEWINVVSKALERVQGATRLEIEKDRRLARLKTRNDRLAREKARYDNITTEDERVLRKPATARPAARPPAVLPEAAAPEAGDPFGDEPPARPVPPPAADPAPVEDEPAVTPDPAEEEATEPPPAKPATKPAADDPFGEEPAEDPVEEAPAKPAAPAAPDGAAAVAPAARPGKAGRSLFGALGKAILGDDGAAAKPKIDLTNAKDPFDDDEAAPPVKTVPVPTQKPAPAEVEDPFSE